MLSLPCSRAKIRRFCLHALRALRAGSLVAQASRRRRSSALSGSSTLVERRRRGAPAGLMRMRLSLGLVEVQAAAGVEPQIDMFG